MQRPVRDRLKLYLILETDMLKMPLEQFIPQVIDGGVTAIQLRDKKKPIREKFETARKLMGMLEFRDVLFCINDRVDLAATIGAESVHVGVKDIPLDAVMNRFPELTIGYSCNTMDDLSYINRCRPAYFGVGPAYFTGTKDDLRPVIGVEGIAQIVAGTDIPAVAIGGINAENAGNLKGIGLAGIAVSSALCAAENPYEAARALRAVVDTL